MKKGLVIFGFKKYGNFILDQEVKTLDDFAWEMQYGKFICYKGKIYNNSFVKGFGYSTIIEGIENGLFWTCTMESILTENKTFWERYAVAIMAGIGIASWYLMFKFLLNF